MSHIRNAILRQISSLGLSVYQVSQMVEDHIPKRTVYAFLSGEKDTGTKTASVIMEALGLSVNVDPDNDLLTKGIDMKVEKPRTLRGRVIAEWKKAGKPNWSPRELLGMCLLVDLEFSSEGLNPAEKFRHAVKSKDYGYLITWAQGLKFKSWK